MTFDKSNSFRSSRRRFLARSGFALLGTTVLGTSLTGCDGSFTATEPANFTTGQYELLTKLSDILIPATDTPGAVGAGVPEFIRRMMKDWARPSTQANIKAALMQLDENANKDKGSDFVALASADQNAVLEKYESLCFSEDSGGTDQSGSADEDTTPDALAGYRTLKMLVYRGYYWSEVGCTQELQYELIPGPDARADAPMAEIGRSWAL